PALVPLARRLTDMGFVLYATEGTSTVLRDNGIRSQALFRISTGRPNVLDLIADKQVSWIVNTPSSGEKARMDEVKMRAEAVIRGIPITTTLNGLVYSVNGLEALRDMKRMEVCSLQEYHRHSPRLKLR
ncbi:MAG: carbamoyl phosphate synthase large subunit, partial [Lentisphaerae bacterium]|nr:carbamoyl phosphate synthase large subunit [Lentisphaerota bacterium]